jgi:hypothetical protein
MLDFQSTQLSLGVSCSAFSVCQLMLDVCKLLLGLDLLALLLIRFLVFGFFKLGLELIDSSLQDSNGALKLLFRLTVFFFFDGQCRLQRLSAAKGVASFYTISNFLSACDRSLNLGKQWANQAGKK